MSEIEEASKFNKLYEIEHEHPVTSLTYEEECIWEPAENDVLSGRGASVNSQPGNKKFRALCFARKPEFDVGNHAAKRRVAVEIVSTTISNWGSRFLKRQNNASPWEEMDFEAALMKAQQVMRDYKRPDRAERDNNSKKRNRSTATPVFADVMPTPSCPMESILEVPEGVHAHDVLCGRGAFVNGHIGNERLRTLAGERKPQFETGGFAEKRALACEIMQKIRALDPPGRFLRKTQSRQASGPPVLEWEEVSDETAIHKACQAMRDIDRPDRKDRIDRKRLKQLKKLDNTPVDATTYQGELGGHFEGFRGHTMHHPELPDDMLPNDMVAEAMNKALGSVPMPNIHGL